MKARSSLAYVAVLVAALLVAVPEYAAAARTVRKSVKAKALSDVCTSTPDISGFLVKPTAGGHIGSADSRYYGYSIICAEKCVSFPATVYHCNGSQAFRMGYYGRWAGNGKSRGYCSSGGTAACSVSQIRSRNRALGCNGVAYIDLDGSKGKKKCMKLNLNRTRNGDV